MAPKRSFQNAGAVPKLDEADRAPSASAHVGTSGLSRRYTSRAPTPGPNAAVLFSVQGSFMTSSPSA